MDGCVYTHVYVLICKQKTQTKLNKQNPPQKQTNKQNLHKNVTMKKLVKNMTSNTHVLDG